MKNYSRLLAIACCLICIACSPSQKTISKATQEQRQTYEAWGNDWVAATQGKVATETIAQVYANGGNIIDAAVAASYVLAVERPQSTGLWGRRFFIIS